MDRKKWSFRGGKRPDRSSRGASAAPGITGRPARGWEEITAAAGRNVGTWWSLVTGAAESGAPGRPGSLEQDLLGNALLAYDRRDFRAAQELLDQLHHGHQLRMALQHARSGREVNELGRDE